jgi:hypothetical protein
MGGFLFLSLSNRQSHELADGKPPQNFNKSRDAAFAGLGYHWLMTDHWMLSLHARYHLTGDWTVLTKTGSETMNANGFEYNPGISLLW